MNKSGSKKVLVDEEIAHLADRYIDLVKELKRLRDGLDQGRPHSEVCIDAVVAVKRFLDANEYVMAAGLTQPFGMVSTALRDLSQGFSPALFKKAKKQPTGSSKTVTLQAVGAAGLDLLLHYGDHGGEAAQFIVQELKKAGFETTGGRRTITKETVLGWRNEMGARNSLVAHNTFKQIVSAAKVQLGEKAKVAAVRDFITGAISALSSEGITTSE